MDSNPQTPNQLLGDLHSLTVDMLALAKKGEVDDLKGLEIQRQKIVERYKKSLSDHPSAEHDVSDKLRQVAAVDAELMTLCQAIKDQIAMQLQEMSAGKKMQQAYTNHSK